MTAKARKNPALLRGSGAPGTIRTSDPQIRSLFCVDGQNGQRRTESVRTGATGGVRGGQSGRTDSEGQSGGTNPAQPGRRFFSLFDLRAPIHCAWSCRRVLVPDEVLP